MVTRSVIESFLDLEPSGVVVSSSADSGPSVVSSASSVVDVDMLCPEVEQLSVASWSPEPVDICVWTIAIVQEDDGTEAAGPVYVIVQTEVWMCVSNKLIDHVKRYLLCKVLRWLGLAIFP